MTVGPAGGDGNKVQRCVARAGAQKGCGHAGRKEWPKACVVGWWPMCGGLSEVAARWSVERGGAALSLSSCWSVRTRENEVV